MGTKGKEAEGTGAESKGKSFMPPESTITAAILGKLKVVPYSYVLPFHGSVFGKAGVPDILFWKGSVSFAFEVKGLRGKTSRIQEVQLERMRRAGVIAAVVRSVDEVRAILGSYGIEM
jgi:hypothetical protein